MNELIGHNEGTKFRVFAQSLTLRKLVQLANVHLENLNGRYIIQKQPGQDLDLEIVDTFQGNSRRSMGSLSGGEKFLVSLSLAMGLSDLASRQSSISTLFIDEGFGTLDDEALDLAISAMENLQARGKTIGLISHVKALKERIATQVRVMKQGAGISVVEMPEA
jgi:exonuclease SbcC